MLRMFLCTYVCTYVRTLQYAKCLIFGVYTYSMYSMYMWHCTCVHVHTLLCMVQYIEKVLLPETITITIESESAWNRNLHDIYSTLHWLMIPICVVPVFLHFIQVRTYICMYIQMFVRIRMLFSCFYCTVLVSLSMCPLAYVHVRRSRWLQPVHIPLTPASGGCRAVSVLCAIRQCYQCKGVHRQDYTAEQMFW